MFYSEPGSARVTLAARAAGILIGTALMVIAVTLMISARATPFYFLVLLAAIVVAELRWPVFPWARPPRVPTAVWPLVALIAYAAASALWSDDPSGALGKAATALVVLAVTVFSSLLISARTKPELAHMGEGLWIGYVFALGFVAFELATGQWTVRFIANFLGLSPGHLRPPEFYHFANGRLVSIEIDAISRNMTPISLLLWPSLFAMTELLDRRIAEPAAVALVVFAIVVAFASPHETTKAAVIVGLIVLLLMIFARVWGLRLVRAGWIAACLLPIPIALGIHKAGVHKMDWLPYSARHRVMIWQRAADFSLRAPIFGSGAHSTYRAAKLSDGQRGSRDTIAALHQHNVYLQTWQELGLVGALLLTVSGLGLIRAVARWPEKVQPYALATFASAAAVGALSYGLWQSWFLSLFGFTGVLVVLAAALAKGSTTGVARQ